VENISSNSLSKLHEIIIDHIEEKLQHKSDNLDELFNF
jgi:hypothetical protein